jgi:predicted acylesterase/phospholipase RssA
MSTPDAQKPFRVLSLDGGGMRGLYTAVVLETLAMHFARKREPRADSLDIGKGFDLIVGTSTGGILACSLAFGLPLSKLADLYRVEGPKIFTDPMPDNDDTLKLVRWLLRNRKKAANKDDANELRPGKTITIMCCQLQSSTCAGLSRLAIMGSSRIFVGEIML